MLSNMVQTCKPGKAATGALQGPPPVVTQVTLVAFEDDLAIKAMSFTQSSLHGLNVETSKVCYYLMWESKPLLFCYQINKKGSEFIGRLSTATHSTYDLNGMFPPLGWRRLDARVGALREAQSQRRAECAERCRLVMLHMQVVLLLNDDRGARLLHVDILL